MSLLGFAGTSRYPPTSLRRTFNTVSEIAPDGTQRQRLVVKDFDAADADALAAITVLRRMAAGDITVKLADKRQALIDLARLKGWIEDKPVDQRNLVVLKVER